jgi:predicted transcriptional regulator
MDSGHRVKTNLTLSPETVDRLDAIAYADRTNRSQLVDEAVKLLFEKKESERGEPYPQR